MAFPPPGRRLVGRRSHDGFRQPRNHRGLLVAIESQGASMSLTRPVRTLRGWTRNPHLPVRTVRMRLTLLYGALFLLSGAALLAVAYTLTWKATSPPADKVLINDARLYAADPHPVTLHTIRDFHLPHTILPTHHPPHIHQLL